MIPTTGSNTETETLVCLQIHNDYLIPGGETKTAKLIADLLEEFEIKVIRYYKTNDAIAESVIGKVKTGLASLYNEETKREIEQILKESRVDFALVHNVSPVISNAAYDILIQRNIPVIKYLQNYNLVCLNGALDQGEDCIRCQAKGSVGVKKACYKGSKVYSLMKLMAKNDMTKHYLSHISAFMPNSQFVMNQHVKFGVDASKMHVMYNYITGGRITIDASEKYKGPYLYFGRISREKGVFTVAEAFSNLKDCELTIMGSGELESELAEYIESNQLSNIHYIGPKSGNDLCTEVACAKCVIVPSEWDEPLPRTILEAYLQSTPVIGSNRGGIPEMISERTTGFIFKGGDIKALLEAVGLMEKLTQEEYEAMTFACLDEIQKKYTKQQYFNRFKSCLKEVGV